MLTNFNGMKRRIINETGEEKNKQSGSAMLIGAQLEKTKILFFFVFLIFFCFFTTQLETSCCLSSAPTRITHSVVSLFLQYLGRWSHYHDDYEISFPCRVRVYPEGRKIEGN